jgi:hypothetical protein
MTIVSRCVCGGGRTVSGVEVHEVGCAFGPPIDYTTDLRRQLDDLQTRKAGGETGLDYRIRQIWEAWFRASCADGRPPDALGRRDPDEARRFYAHVQEGADHAYWCGPRRFETNAGKEKLPARWVMERYLGRPLNPYLEIVRPSCREPRCVRIAHLEVRPHIRRNDAWTEGQLIETMRATYRRLGRVPSLRERYKDDHLGLPHPRTFQRLFGGWNAAWEAAGFTVRATGGQRKWTDDEMLDVIRARSAELNGAPIVRDRWDRDGLKPTSGAIRRRFGTWRRALDLAGVR